MFIPSSNIPEFDQEQAALLKASDILESLGNEPGLTVDQFYASLVQSGHPEEEHESLYLAAIAIETMMVYDQQESESLLGSDPTVH